MENNLYSLFTENPGPPVILVDAHQDLAWNMLSFGRDYTRPVAETRQREAGTITPGYTGDTLLGWPEYQKGRVAVVFSTLFAALPAAVWAIGIRKLISPPPRLAHLPGTDRRLLPAGRRARGQVPPDLHPG